MERPDVNPEKPDIWRPAILSERQKGETYKSMLRALKYVGEVRDRALVLGDASLIQSKYLVEGAGFKHVVDVDSSPSIMDDDVISKDDTRVERIVQTFDGIVVDENSFDFIYGKSIAFNPKESIQSLLARLASSLKDGAVFCAVWAGEGDDFREEHYSEEELRELYSKNDLEIVLFEDGGLKKSEGLLGSIKMGHQILIIAKKKVNLQ